MPDDYYADNAKSLSYIPGLDGEFVVYSIGSDGIDDVGQESKAGAYEGDYTFRIATLSFRTGPQVQEAAIE